MSYLPHWDFLLAEEKNVDLSGHLRRPLEENIEVEEVFHRRDQAQRLQLLAVGLLLLLPFPWLLFSLIWFGLIFLSFLGFVNFLVSSLALVLLGLSEVLLWRLTLVVPKLPVALKLVHLRHDMVSLDLCSHSGAASLVHGCFLRNSLSGSGFAKLNLCLSHL